MNLRIAGKSGMLALLITVILLLGPGVASASTYVGATYAWVDGNNSDLEDETTNGWRAFLGASASGVFGWEIGYGQLSELRGRTVGRVEASTADASLLIGLPAGPLRFFGRAGAVYGSVDSDVGSRDDWTYRYGVGVDVGLGKTFGLRFEWDRTPLKTEFDDLDVDTAQAGIFFRF